MHWLVFGVLLLSGLIQACTAGNCSQAETITLFRPGGMYVVGSLSAVLQPTSGGMPIDGSRLEWALLSLVERGRATQDTSGMPLPFSKCRDPGDADFSLFDQPNPYQPRVPTESCIRNDNVPCGELYRVLHAVDLDCWNYHEVAPFHGTSRESVYVHYTHPDHPNFRMVASFHLTDDSVLIYPIENSTLVKNSYEPGMLKINYEIDGFPWAGPTDIITGSQSNASFLGLWFNNTIEVLAGNLSIINLAENRLVNFSSADGKTKLILDVDSSYIIDGEPFLSLYNGSTYTFVSESALPPISLISSVSMCASGAGLWNSAVYDPSLGYLFSDDPAQPVDPNTPRSKSGLSAAAIASISVFVPVLIGIIVAGVVIMVVLPKIRNGRGLVPAKPHSK